MLLDLLMKPRDFHSITYAWESQAAVFIFSRVLVHWPTREFMIARDIENVGGVGQLLSSPPYALSLGKYVARQGQHIYFQSRHMPGAISR